MRNLLLQVQSARDNSLLRPPETHFLSSLGIDVQREKRHILRKGKEKKTKLQNINRQQRLIVCSKYKTTTSRYDFSDVQKTEVDVR